MNIKNVILRCRDNGCFIPKCPIFPTFSIKSMFILKRLFKYGKHIHTYICIFNGTHGKTNSLTKS